MGRLTKKTLPNGAYTDYTYNNVNQLLSLINKKSDATNISSFSYTHDKVGNRLSMMTTEGTHNYAYDTTYRLTSADHPVQPNETYTYDKVGNRLTSADHPSWSYDANNRLLSYNGTNFTYDKNGNLIKKDKTGTITNYNFDYENRLITISDTTNASYNYDAFGKRLSKTVDGITKYYLYDNEDIIAEYNSAGSLTANYVHGQGIDEPISRTTQDAGPTTHYYTFDGLGSVRELTDGSQNVIESYKYDSFGKLETPPTTENPYTYTGREYDTESGLYYYRARYYDAGAGRFLSEDPILLPRINYDQDTVSFSIEWGALQLIHSPSLLHPYSYTGNNPLNHIDPDGLKWWDPTHWPFPGTNYCGGFTSGPGTIRSCIDACCYQHDKCLEEANKFCLDLRNKKVRECHIGLLRCLRRCRRTREWPGSESSSRA